MSIEHDLRRALRRKEPSDGFTRRVLARIGNEPSDRRSRAHATRRQTALRWLAAAAAALLITGGTSQYVRHRRMRSEMAKAEVMAALAIASEKLQLVRQIMRDHN